MATTKIRVELKPRVVLLSIAAGYGSPYVAETTRLIMNAARIEAPVRTGNLRALIGMKMRVSRKLVIGQVYSKAKYSHFVHDATSPHLIRARRAQFLRFEVPPGVVHFRKVVRHPGTKGQPFLREPMRRIGRARDFQVTGYSAASGKVGFGLALD